jgi:hypothetical protein
LKIPSEAELIEMEHRALKLYGQAQRSRQAVSTLRRRSEDADWEKAERMKLDALAEEYWADTQERIAEDFKILVATVRDYVETRAGRERERQLITEAERIARRGF